MTESAADASASAATTFSGESIMKIINVPSHVLGVLAVLCVLFNMGCATQVSGKVAATPANQEKTLELPPADERLVQENRDLRLQLEQLRLGQSSGNQNATQPTSPIPGLGEGGAVVRYDPQFSPMIPSRTVFLPGEKRAFVAFEGLGGWAPCYNYMGAWRPVNLEGRMVMALTSEMPGCIVATDCPPDPDGICRKELTIIWLERSSPSHVVNRQTTTVEMQRCSQCKSIGGACYQRGPRQICAGG